MKRKKLKHKGNRLEIRCSDDFMVVLARLCEGKILRQSQSKVLQDALFHYARHAVYWHHEYDEQMQMILYGQVIFKNP